jgi:hypothetical protein
MSTSVPGCGKQFDLVTKVEQRRIDREFNPAPYIAREKLETEKKAAAEHAVRGCATASLGAWNGW